jgi:hypothetical protein
MKNVLCNLIITAILWKPSLRKTYSPRDLLNRNSVVFFCELSNWEFFYLKIKLYFMVISAVSIAYTSKDSINSFRCFGNPMEHLISLFNSSISMHETLQIQLDRFSWMLMLEIRGNIFNVLKLDFLLFF